MLVHMGCRLSSRDHDTNRSRRKTGPLTLIEAHSVTGYGVQFANIFGSCNVISVISGQNVGSHGPPWYLPQTFMLLCVHPYPPRELHQFLPAVQFFPASSVTGNQFPAILSTADTTLPPNPLPHPYPAPAFTSMVFIDQSCSPISIRNLFGTLFTPPPSATAPYSLCSTALP